MVVFDLARISLMSMLAAAPAPVTGAVSPMVDSSVVTMTDTVTPVLTTEGLAKFNAFVTAYFKAPQPVRDSAAKYRMMVPMPAIRIVGVSNVLELPPFNATDMLSLAKYNATVASEFKAAGTTPEEYVAWRRALAAALLMYDADKKLHGDAGALDTTTTTGKNALFVKAHPTEMAALKTAGMTFPDYQIQFNQNAAPPGGISLPTVPQGGVAVPPGGVQVPTPPPATPPNK